ncbi:RagB/SusD family nutrient uptake outer membrane protein [Pedobacter metabolipauper]|uniref:RagB/SusD domain-containing protein n=1 Tax=Pedobacter metabolipauper TaxID=425513 RepID=A0A4R6SUK2_9SPHI|nr:RagB/SusD family nutrient uptake outer membrane protein [Pedobacter metabolipauper]TDQ08653.1 RagB/SusD domain-containing protein [Pedobacter metabolipauper]
MKNILKSIYFSFFILALAGCKKDFIALNPISNANEENFYKTEDDFTNAIYGAYSSLKSNGIYNDYMQLVGDLRSDNTEMGSTASSRFAFYELSQFQVQQTSEIVESIWKDHYVGIRRANTILSRINDAGISQNSKNRITAESQFLRALYYFNLVRVFGNVPLVTKSIQTIEESYTYGRTDVKTVYNQIIEDLLNAAPALPLTVKGEEGRATQGAANALLGKVYLTLHDYQNAKTSLEKVISSKQYDILPDYSSLWNADAKNHKESIFEVQFKTNLTASTGSQFTERYTPYLFPNLPYSSTAGGYNIPREDLINAYEATDLRKNASLKENYTKKDGTVVRGLEGRYTYKFHDMPVKGGGADDNWPVLRYADVLLMYAESLNEISFTTDGEAFKQLNAIRKRAGLPEKTFSNANPLLAINSQEEFRTAIEKERRVEFAFEGHRWFDLLRTGKAIAILGPKIKTGLVAEQLLLPIPLSQIDVNPDNIKQNPGYQ